MHTFVKQCSIIFLIIASTAIQGMQESVRNGKKLQKLQNEVSKTEDDLNKAIAFRDKAEAIYETMPQRRHRRWFTHGASGTLIGLFLTNLRVPDPQETPVQEMKRIKLTLRGSILGGLIGLFIAEWRHLNYLNNLEDCSEVSAIRNTSYSTLNNAAEYDVKKRNFECKQYDIIDGERRIHYQCNYDLYPQKRNTNDRRCASHEVLQAKTKHLQALENLQKFMMLNQNKFKSETA